MSRVFISHSTRDRAFVEDILVPALHSYGLETWYSKNDIQAADRWERSILNGLESCDWFLIVLSPNSAKSDWVADELHWAMSNRHGRIVPVMIEACNPYDFHIRLPRLQPRRVRSADRLLDHRTAIGRSSRDSRIDRNGPPRGCELFVICALIFCSAHI
jgi:hypothetical protein